MAVGDTVVLHAVITDAPPPVHESSQHEQAHYHNQYEGAGGAQQQAHHAYNGMGNMGGGAYNSTNHGAGFRGGAADEADWPLLERV